MDKLTVFLNDAFGAHLSPVFVKRATYNADMDFLEYVSCDDVTVSDRIDPFLTVMWNYEQTDIVGFRLKGFRCIFNEILKKVSHLKDEDFDPLVDTLKLVFTKFGNDLFPAPAEDSSRADAYKSTVRLIKQDKVHLPEEVTQAIAA